MRNDKYIQKLSNISNRGISKEYQAILDARSSDFALGTPDANTIEPFLVWIFKLMDCYKRIHSLSKKKILNKVKLVL